MADLALLLLAAVLAGLPPRRASAADPPKDKDEAPPKAEQDSGRKDAAPDSVDRLVGEVGDWFKRDHAAVASKDQLRDIRGFRERISELLIKHADDTDTIFRLQSQIKALSEKERELGSKKEGKEGEDEEAEEEQQQDPTSKTLGTVAEKAGVADPAKPSGGQDPQQEAAAPDGSKLDGLFDFMQRAPGQEPALPGTAAEGLGPTTGGGKAGSPGAPASGAAGRSYKRGSVSGPEAGGAYVPAPGGRASAPAGAAGASGAAAATGQPAGLLDTFLGGLRGFAALLKPAAPTLKDMDSAMTRGLDSLAKLRRADGTWSLKQGPYQWKNQRDHHSAVTALVLSLPQARERLAKDDKDGTLLDKGRKFLDENVGHSPREGDPQWVNYNAYSISLGLDELLERASRAEGAERAKVDARIAEVISKMSPDPSVHDQALSILSLLQGQYQKASPELAYRAQYSKPALAPPGSATSFQTAMLLDAMQRAKDAGYSKKNPQLDRIIATLRYSLEAARDGKGNWDYHMDIKAPPAAGAPAPALKTDPADMAGPMGGEFRSMMAEYSLYRSGASDATRLHAAVERLVRQLEVPAHSFNERLGKGDVLQTDPVNNKWSPHDPTLGFQARYYYHIGVLYAAQALRELPPDRAGTAKLREPSKLAESLTRHLLAREGRRIPEGANAETKKPEDRGLWEDSSYSGPAYGTAAAVRSLELLAGCQGPLLEARKASAALQRSLAGKDDASKRPQAIESAAAALLEASRGTRGLDLLGRQFSELPGLRDDVMKAAASPQLTPAARGALADLLLEQYPGDRTAAMTALRTLSPSGPAEVPAALRLRAVETARRLLPDDPSAARHVMQGLRPLLASRDGREAAAAVEALRQFFPSSPPPYLQEDARSAERMGTSGRPEALRDQLLARRRELELRQGRSPAVSAFPMRGADLSLEAVRSLEGVRSHEAVELLQAALGHQDPRVRLAAAHGLAAMAPPAGASGSDGLAEHAARSRHALVALALDDPNPAVRGAASLAVSDLCRRDEALAKGYRRTLGPLALSLGESFALKPDDPRRWESLQARWMDAQASRSMGIDEGRVRAFRTELSGLGRGQDAGTRAQAAGMLLSLSWRPSGAPEAGGTEAADTLLGAARASADLTSRSAAAYWLRYAGGEQTRERAVKSLEGLASSKAEDVYVRQSALESLSILQPGHPLVQEVLRASSRSRESWDPFRRYLQPQRGALELFTDPGR